MSWGRYITGWAAVEVSGAEPERLLYALAERGITFWGATPPRDFSLTVLIPESAAKLIVPLSAAMGCEGRVRAHYGLPALLRKFRRRHLLVCCALAVLGLLYAGSAYVWDIDITGNETIPEGVIRQALSQCGVDIGAYWPSFSQDTIRNGMMLRVPRIRWMTVTIRGGHAHVIIRETREHLPVVREREYANIVAAKAGLVEDIQDFRGTAVTEEGRTVLPGEVLIGGYITGRVGVQGPARAIGSVTARTWYEWTAQAPLNVGKKTGEGHRRVQWALIVGKTRINFYKDSSICPAGCDKIIESYTLARKGLFALPVTLEKTVFTSYECETVPAAGLPQDMEDQLSNLLRREVGEDGEILSCQFTASEGDGLLYVTARAECREQIGRDELMTETDIAQIMAQIPKTEEEDP